MLVFYPHTKVRCEDSPHLKNNANTLQSLFKFEINFIIIMLL
jgi:hypothetical protein